MDPLSSNIRPEVYLAVVIPNDVFHVNWKISPLVTKQFLAAALDPIMDILLLGWSSLGQIGC